MTTHYSGTGDPTRSLALLWGEREVPKRGPKPRLSVPVIVKAAIDVADTEGIATLSMRRVGEELHTSPMSLYTYIPGKAELLDLMLDTAYGELPQPQIIPSKWRDALASIARENWALYLRHPWLLHVASSRPVLGPNVMAKYDYELSAVDGLGLNDVEMDLMVGFVTNYVHGAARGATEAAQAAQHTGLTDEQWWNAHAPLLEKVFDPQRFPLAARVGAAAGDEYQAPADHVRQFDFGLDLILDGIAALVASKKTSKKL
ncbi:MAG: TetR/AcrR family transcriptional regulator [Corynebacteriales bacterium]|nr:TetR/AcrR family transcriptional regulator [Mycobacteriales bacterium]